MDDGKVHADSGMDFFFVGRRRLDGQTQAKRVACSIK
jgi:hypothetical protein